MFPCFFLLEDPSFPDQEPVQLLLEVHAVPAIGERVTFANEEAARDKIYEVQRVVHGVGKSEDGNPIHAITVIAVRLFM